MKTPLHLRHFEILPGNHILADTPRRNILKLGKIRHTNQALGLVRMGRYFTIQDLVSSNIRLNHSMET